MIKPKEKKHLTSLLRASASREKQKQGRENCVLSGDEVGGQESPVCGRTRLGTSNHCLVKGICSPFRDVPNLIPFSWVKDTGQGQLFNALVTPVRTMLHGGCHTTMCCHEP